MADQLPSSDPPQPSEPVPTSTATRKLRSEELLAGEQEIEIVHGDETYRLRLTRNGKLILHK